MALNFTPLTAYRIEVMDGIRQRAENQRRMGEGLGAILGTAQGIADAQKTRDFFASRSSTTPRKSRKLTTR